MFRRSCPRRRLACIFLAFWTLLYIGIALVYTIGSGDPQYIADDRAVPPGPAEALPPLPPPPPTQIFDEFVDKNSICERAMRGILPPDDLNATLIYACDRWTAAQNHYFRVRERRVNEFEPDRLTIVGDRICNNDTYLIVLVHSLHKYSDRRTAIRRTWGGASVEGRWPVRTVAGGGSVAQAR